MESFPARPVMALRGAGRAAAESAEALRPEQPRLAALGPEQAVLPLGEFALRAAPRLPSSDVRQPPMPLAEPPAAEPVVDGKLQRAPSLPAPEALHPALWRADQVGLQRGIVWPSGHARLDTALPGGGWPSSALTELLLPHAGIGEIRLLAPALAAVQQRGRCVILFEPPALPFGCGLQSCGLDLQQLFVVRRRHADRVRGHLPAADVLWALEQALKSGHAGAALAWLPMRLLSDTLRRLQLAAQSHAGPVFLLRDDAARFKPSPAPLRLWLRSPRPDTVRVQLLKRRGAPLAQAIELQLPAICPTEESGP